MNMKKTTRLTKASEPINQRPRPGLRLLKPQSECSTPGLVAELSEEVKAMLRGQKRRRGVRANDDPPEAA